MAKNLYFYGVLLLIVFASCDRFYGGYASDESIVLGDTIRVIKYEKKPTIIRDTVYIYRDRENTKAQNFIDTLKSYLGTRELTGENDGPVVEKFTHVACNMGKVAWCGAVIGYGLKVNGIETPDCVCWTPCLFPKEKVVWRQGDSHKLESGQIFGLYFASLKRIAHAGTILEDYGDGWVLTIEGNTNDAGSRDGNGMFTRLRHKSQLYIAAKWV